MAIDEQEEKPSFFVRLMREQRRLRAGIQRRRDLVALPWYLRLRIGSLLTSKIRVGFGYINTSDRTLSNRKWHIDPIVDEINRSSDRYRADIFFPGDRLWRFDIVVILKVFKYTSEREMQQLRRRGTILLFNISDNPAGAGPAYYDAPWFLDALHGLLLLSPAQAEPIVPYENKFFRIRTPVIDRRHKADYRPAGKVRLFWDGYASNLFTMERLNPIVRRLAGEVTEPIEMVYNSNIPEAVSEDGLIRYERWTIENYREKIIAADIGVLIKPIEDDIQRRKPASKVISYMAAGLPVVCSPSPADREVVEHGVTGFFAETDDEWLTTLRMLIADRALRERVGRAARDYVIREHSLAKVTAEYLAIFDELRARQVVDGRRSLDR